MAKNINLPPVTDSLRILDATVTVSPHTTSPVSGDPVLITGNVPGTAVADKDSVTGLTPVRIDQHIVEQVVKGIKSTGNAAIVAGNGVYMQSDGTLDGNSKGTPYGLAYGNSLDPAVNVLGTDTRSGNLVASGVTTTTIRIHVGMFRAPLDGAVTFVKAKAFVSTEQTANGSAQSIAHGLGVIPTCVLIIATDTAPSTAGVFTVVEGSHDATSVVVTVTSGKKYKVFAWA